MTTRSDRYREAVLGRPIDKGCSSEIDTDDLGRFLLIEVSRFDGELWITTFDSPDDAGVYRDNQEFPEDWPRSEFYDLDTGDRYSESTKTTYVKDDAP